MVVEVSYVEWTPDGLLRHVVYLGEREDKNLYLYKLHGSIDWKREPTTGKLTYSDSDSSSTIKVEEAALIFGTAYKLQYVDPFLFLVYQLRRWSLEARLILVVGYGFGDEHINSILVRRSELTRKSSFSP